MAQELLSIQELAQLRTYRMQICAQFEQSHSQDFTYALGTSLDLQGIARPKSDSCINNTVYIATHDRDKRIKYANSKWIVWKKEWAEILVNKKFVCVSPTYTWMMYAARLPFHELIELADAMMRRDSRLKRATLQDFYYALSTFNNVQGARAFKGIEKCKKAILLARENTDSIQETRTRLILMKYGLPCPDVNYKLTLTSSKVYYLDMAYPEYRIAIEYDGIHHAQQWLNDSRRRNEIESAGWKYIQVTKLDLENAYKRQQLASRVCQYLPHIECSAPVELIRLTDRRTTLYKNSRYLS